MDTLTAIRKRDRALTQLRDLYSSAETFGLTSYKINERYSGICAGLHGCPEWAREYVNGYRQCLNDALYRYKLVHGGFVGCTFYSTHSKRGDYYGHLINPCDWSAWGDNGRVTQRGHYWANHVDSGNPKPFFIGIKHDQT